MAKASDKPLVWFKAGINTPPFSPSGKRDAGFLLRKLQQGQKLSLPHSRPMPSIGPRCHELRIEDGEMRKSWRIFYRIDSDAIVIAEVEEKRTQQTPKGTVERVKARLKRYDVACGGEHED